MILKQLEKGRRMNGRAKEIGSDPYLRLREQKKTLDTLQEECDVKIDQREINSQRCVDESNVDLEELGELILQYILNSERR